jgi:hypothetical protein
MLDNTGYGPSLRRRGSGNVLTHTVMAVLGAALATGLLLAFYNPAACGGYGDESEMLARLPGVLGLLSVLLAARSGPLRPLAKRT